MDTNFILLSVAGSTMNLRKKKLARDVGKKVILIKRKVDLAPDQFKLNKTNSSLYLN